MSNPSVIPNQVFIGCPWKTVKPKYERLIEQMEKKYPLSFILIGREETQDAEDLLGLIRTALDSSTYAIFDATGGNANVSLEYGYAEGRNIPRALYLSSHRAVKKSSADHPIISDLAGKKHIPYKTLAALKRNIHAFAKNHAYSKRFETYLKSSYAAAPRGVKKSLRALSLKAIHHLDGRVEVRRSDLIQHLQSVTPKYNNDDFDFVLKKLQKSGPIEVSAGRYSDVSIS